LAAVLSFGVAWWAFAADAPNAFTPTGIVVYVLTAATIVWVTDQYRLLLRRLQQREAANERQLVLIGAENDVLAGVVSGAPIGEALGRLAKSIEDYSGGEMLASVLLMDVDGRHLRHGAAPSLPAAYNQAIDGVAIGPAVGSCGTAAFRGEPDYVADIQTDPLWADFRHLAEAHGLRACWSIPLLSQTRAVLGTFALYHREPRTPRPDEIEIVQLMARIATVAITHEEGRNQRQLLVDELTHRVKNVLAVVQAIAGSTLRAQTDKHAYAGFEARLAALARAQGLLTETNWRDIEVADLVKRVVLEPFAADTQRFHVEGPPLRFPARLTLPFALSLHELSTNAAKYGALSTESGRVNIDWGWLNGDGAARQFYFRWREAGGPAVGEPKLQGFGSRMIKQAFAAEPSSHTTIDYLPEGVRCEISIPLDQ
jgi:two-component sensor histidine kinase